MGTLRLISLHSWNRRCWWTLSWQLLSQDTSRKRTCADSMFCDCNKTQFFRRIPPNKHNSLSWLEKCPSNLLSHNLAHTAHLRYQTVHRSQDFGHTIHRFHLACLQHAFCLHTGCLLRILTRLRARNLKSTDFWILRNQKLDIEWLTRMWKRFLVLDHKSCSLELWSEWVSLGYLHSHQTHGYLQLVLKFKRQSPWAS